MELSRMYFQNNKTGKIRSPKAIAGFAVLMVVVFASVGFAFVGVSMALADQLHFAGLDWLYFSMTGMISIAVGLFGSVFTTFASLYLARDNELLLSMPISSKMLLAIRMIAVYLSSLLYSALVWIPAVGVYTYKGYMTAKEIAFCAVLQILLSAIVTVLTCALGWVIALFSGRVKNKSFVTALFTVAFMGGYYFVQFKLNSFLQYFAINGGEIAGKIGNTVKAWIYPMYQFGLAGAGNAKSLAIIAAIAIALSVLCYSILSATFIRLLTTNRGAKKTEYKEKSAKSSSINAALIRKELKRLTKSPTYLINGGLGLVIMPVFGIIALIKKEDLMANLGAMYAAGDYFKNAIPVFVASIICIMISLNLIAPPSVSLEGKNLWLLQSLPVSAQKVLQAKKTVPVLLNTAPALIGAVALSIAFNFDALSIASIIAIIIAYIFFNASFGLYLGVKKANVEWTNEVVPIKQSSAVMISMFGGMGISGIMSVGYYFLQSIPSWIYLFGVAIIFVPVIFILNRWIKNTGSEIFATL